MTVSNVIMLLSVFFIIVTAKWFHAFSHAQYNVMKKVFQLKYRTFLGMKPYLEILFIFCGFEIIEFYILTASKYQALNIFLNNNLCESIIMT